MFCGRTRGTLYLLGIPYLLSLILLGDSARAQDASTGALRGVVVDAQGARVTRADIVAIRVETGIRYHAATDAAGRFTLDLLPPGYYVARAEAEGMSPQNSPRVEVEVGAATELTFKLSVAGVKETVTVSGAPKMVETDPGSVSVLLDERAITDLPLNGRRFTDLLLLAPGVTQDPRGLTSGSNGDLSYGGIRGYQSSYLVDGADNNNGFFAQARGRYRSPYQFSNEVVQEFRVSSSGYGAESGRAGGAVVNVVTKSGTNHWHGTGFYFLRDSLLSAAPAFVGFKPSDQQHQFGGTFGGPIQRNRTFFLAGFDQHIFHVPTVVEFLDGGRKVVPRAGTGPNDPGDYEICDPAVGGQSCDKDLVFASGAQLSTMGGTFHGKLLGNAGFLKVDHALTARHFLSARLSTSRYYGANNVFFDPASPITFDALSGNGEEDVKTESVSLALLSNVSPRLTSHLRAQWSRDLQQSFPNATGVRTKIYNVMDGFGQATILPRETREHRLHLAETVSRSGGRHEWKFGGDAMFTWDFNYFPSIYGGEYFYDNIHVDPWTFVPMHGGMEITPLRAWAHDVPRYYVQNFGSPVSHPDSNDYAAFVQDTIRLTPHLAASLGVRYDLQTFGTAGMVSNPLWPASGKMPSRGSNFAPRVGFAYGLGDQRPLVVRAGFGIFYVRIPQIYQSTVINDNGMNSQFLSLDNMDYYQRQLFPAYPNAAVHCGPRPVSCALPDALKPYATAEVAAFAPDFRTPRAQQGSLSLERELADGFAGGLSYLYVHGVDMIRARDVNLPSPTEYSYPIYDPSGQNFQNAYYTVDSFGTWQMTQTLSCPFPPCINNVARPVPQLGAIDQFESASSSVYHGLTVSLHRRMSHGLYFRLAYTWAHAIDDGQDALVAGQPATVQNSYAAKSERGPSVTDQRQRFSLSWMAEPRPIAGQGLPSKIVNHWKVAGVMTYGSGRPTDARVSGDPNQDGNTSNDRLAGYGRNSFVGPDYATMDLRLSRKVKLGGHYRLELTGESFNLLNRDNRRYVVTDNGFYNSSGQFVQLTKKTGGRYYPAYYQRPTSFMKATSAYAPRQMQVAMRLIF
ncbi:MAG: TonB-dependent receptor [Terriglobales bacterium]